MNNMNWFLDSIKNCSFSDLYDLKLSLQEGIELAQNGMLDISWFKNYSSKEEFVIVCQDKLNVLTQLLNKVN